MIDFYRDEVSVKRGYVGVCSQFYSCECFFVSENIHVVLESCFSFVLKSIYVELGFGG